MIFKCRNSIKKQTTIRQNRLLYGVYHTGYCGKLRTASFLKFHSDYHISLGNIALISTFFFFTQLLVDLFCANS